ncbi:uncharacterized protein LOC144096650 [Amblyomma americanum]
MDSTSGHTEVQHLPSAVELKERPVSTSTRGPYQCDVCQKILRRRASLVEHVRVHTGERPFACNLCPAAFSRSSTMRTHVLQHKGYKPHKCHLCPKAFIARADFECHLRAHGAAERFECPHCPASFAAKQSLRAHIRSHTELYSVIVQPVDGCTRCKDSGDSRSGLAA